MSVTPIIAALAMRLDQSTAKAIAELDKKQDWPRMLVLARAELQREPGNSDWWFLQGYALARQGQHTEAIASYERAVRISPEDEGSWLSLAQSQIELGQPERAIRTYRQVLRVRPESAHAYLGLAELYQKQGQADLAISNYRESVRYDPDGVQAWSGLAAAYQKSGQRERLEEALQHLRKLDHAAADKFEKQYPSK